MHTACLVCVRVYHLPTEPLPLLAWYMLDATPTYLDVDPVLGLGWLEASPITVNIPIMHARVLWPSS